MQQSNCYNDIKTIDANFANNFLFDDLLHKIEYIHKYIAKPMFCISYHVSISLIEFTK